MDRSPFANGCIVDAKPTDLRASMVANSVVSDRAIPESCAKNVAFSIVSCSGQDDDFPASELNKGVVGRGWQSARFCCYPQELVVHLQFPSRIINMQLLCHEFKIPSKVEIFVGLAPFSEQTVGAMKRLGYLSLDPNDRSGFQARELKSIHVDAPASTVRLLLHNCYTNKLNTYNQVGLVALIITGDRLTEQQSVQCHQHGLIPLVQTPSTYEAASPDSDTSSISMSRSQESFGNVAYNRKQLTSSRVSDANLGTVDSLTASRIRKLLQEKSAAVQEEDYDEAKRLKILIEKLNALGEKIKELEMQKLSAVEEEDYDTAKLLKLEVEKLRQSSGMHQNGAFNCRALADSGHGVRVSSKLLEEMTPTQPVSEGKHGGFMEFSGDRQENLKKSFEVVQALGKGSDNGNGNISLLRQENVSQMKAVNKSATELMIMDEMLPPELAKGGPGDEVMTPEPLPEAVLKDLAPVLAALGQYQVQCLYSRQWQLRDRALQQLEKDMLYNKLNGDSLTTFRVVSKVILRTLGDKVSNVFHTSLQLLRSFVTKYAAEVSARDLQTCVADLAVILIDKMGDSNARIKEDATKTVMFVTLKKEIGLPVMAPLLLKPAKSLAIWKPILGRLQLLLVAIPMFGFQPQSRGGFNVDALMAFVVQGFSSPNGDVRNTAVKVSTEVYKLIGLQVERHLKGIKSAIREVLTANFEKVGGNTGGKVEELVGPQHESNPGMKRPSLKALIKADQKVATEIKGSKGVGALMVEGQGKVRDSNEDLQATASFSKIGEEMPRPSPKISGQLTNNFSQESYGDGPPQQANPMKARSTNVRSSQPNGADVTKSGFQQAQAQDTGHEEAAESCLFCGMEDRRFAEGDCLDMHFCQGCPMLTGCINCRQIVEIATLKEHFLYECTAGKRYLECQRCLQAIPEARVTLHMKSKECRRSKHQKTARCPLCQHSVQPGDAGWREHLLKAPGCPKNPRTCQMPN